MVISSELTLICKPIGIQIEDQESSGQIARLLHRHLIFLFRVTITNIAIKLKIFSFRKTKSSKSNLVPSPKQTVGCPV